MAPVTLPFAWAVGAVIAAAVALAAPAPGVGVQVQPRSSHAKETLNVFFIPHSHCDAGWLKTIDEYYEQEVKYIYNTVVSELAKRADRKFIIVEMVFFSRWFNEASAAERNYVRECVANKRIEFVLGGWVMNDDADPTFSASMNQMAEGHKWIFDTFGVTPRYGWHIDPFGLSSYYPTMFAKMGFNGHVINRIHFVQKDEWKAQRHLEFVWRGSKSLGTGADVFTHVLDSHYSFPNGFNFERDAPINDETLPQRASELVAELQRRAEWYRTSNLLIPGGDDFRWQNATVQYVNWDKLIDYINARPELGVYLHYATLSEYFEAVNQAQVEWPVYESDFFPYADGSDAYWTGYFTSYPNVKSLIRTRASLLRNSEIMGQAAAFSGAPLTASPEQLVPLRQATAESQHHDGVTGTSKNYVMQMYIDHLTDSSDPATDLLTNAISAVVGEVADFDDVPTNINENLGAGQVVPIVVTNGLGWARTQQPVVVELTRSDIEIVNAAGAAVPHQVVTLAGKTTVTFLADVPAAGLSTYFARQTSSPVRGTVTQVAIGQAVTLDNGVLSVNITVGTDGAVSLLITNREDGTFFPLTERIMEYTSYTGNGQKSGAYIFRPVSSAAALLSVGTVQFINGPLYQEVVHTYDSAHAQSFRLVRSSNDDVALELHVSFALGTLDRDREAIARFTSSAFDSASTRLFSDNNGILIHERRPAKGLIASNYYPMVQQAFLADSRLEMLAIVDRTVGVASLAGGEMEVMLHRRCSRDDGRGVGEALDDTTVTYPHLRMFFGTRTAVETLRPRLALALQHPPLPFFGPVTTLAAWTGARTLTFAALRQPLPNNIHLLALKTEVSDNWRSAILRLQHIYDTDSLSGLGAPTTVDIASLFTTSYSVSEELDLSGRLPESQLPRLKWTSSSTITPPWEIPQLHTRDMEFATVFNPMEIHVVKLSFD